MNDNNTKALAKTEEETFARTKDGETFVDLIKAPQMQSRLDAVLKNSSPAFKSALMAVFRGDEKLQECDPQSVLNAAMDAANNNLMVGGTLGHAYIVSYGKKATLIIGYKGLIQLALRSGLVKTINTGIYYKGEVRLNRVTGEIIEGKAISTDKIYVAFIELKNGFSKAILMTRDEIKDYAQKNSSGYRNNQNVWKNNFDEMAEKTVLRILLRKYAPLSVATAGFDFDEENFSENVDPETGEVITVDSEEILKNV